MLSGLHPHALCDNNTLCTGFSSCEKVHETRFLEAGYFRVLSHWTGSCVRMKRKGKVQSGTRVTGREWLLVLHSDPESWLTQPANEYGVASPREYQRGENVLARGLKCLVPSL